MHDCWGTLLEQYCKTIVLETASQNLSTPRAGRIKHSLTALFSPSSTRKEQRNCMSPASLSFFLTALIPTLARAQTAFAMIPINVYLLYWVLVELLHFLSFTYHHEFFSCFFFPFCITFTLKAEWEFSHFIFIAKELPYNFPLSNWRAGKTYPYVSSWKGSVFAFSFYEREKRWLRCIYDFIPPLQTSWNWKCIRDCHRSVADAKSHRALPRKHYIILKKLALPFEIYTLLPYLAGTDLRPLNFHNTFQHMAEHGGCQRKGDSSCSDFQEMDLLLQWAPQIIAFSKS